jgi:hypothetical protein
VGGGAAINVTNLAGIWPHLSVTIADLPTVAESARKKIAETGLEERVRTAELDASQDEFPRGHDVVLFAHFLEISAYFHAVASGEGMVYTCREYESWFREADLEPTGRVMLGPDTVVICGRKL